MNSIVWELIMKKEIIIYFDMLYELSDLLLGRFSSKF